MSDDVDNFAAYDDNKLRYPLNPTWMIEKPFIVILLHMKIINYPLRV